MKEQQVLIDIDSSLYEVLKKMDQVNRKLLVVTSKGQYKSIISIGDVQRGILKGVELDAKISNVLRPNPFIGSTSDSKEKLVNILITQKVDFIPIVDDEGAISEILFWEDYSTEKIHQSKGLEDIPVVIMAGGFGSRLKPITNVIPKALVPIGEKPIIQIIIERFMDYGSREFYISVNYKSEMIVSFLDQLNLECNIHYINEEKPLGTAGSLSLLKKQLTGNFIISNCDILIDQDYVEVLEYHVNNSNSLTAIAAIKEFSIPYGVLETSVNGELSSMTEKPSFKFQVNAGIYILNSSVLDYIPDNIIYNITDLMGSLMERNEVVGVFPVSEGAWFDIGEWKEYMKTQELFHKRY